jgi:hypothetical protein
LELLIEGVSLKAFLEAATKAIDDLPNPPWKEKALEDHGLTTKAE